MDRRQFLHTIAGGSAFFWARGALGSTPNRKAQLPLMIPPLVDTKENGRFFLKAQTGKTDFFSNVSSRTYGYNGNYLGPTIRIHKGQTVQARILNTLAEPTTVHWHGLLVDGVFDGGPHTPIPSGGVWEPVLSIDQRAATLWYHPHIHRRTARQVYNGLAGLLIVEDERTSDLNLPTAYGVDDLPLILQDKMFRNGRMVYTSSMMGMMHGFRGDVFLVNGQRHPVAMVPGGLVRLRLLNAANARNFYLSFSDRRRFHLIATEGGLLDHPLELSSLRLSPGERMEILVDFSDGKTVSLLNHLDRLQNRMGMGMMGRRPRRTSHKQVSLVDFNVNPNLQPKTTNIPKKLVETVPPVHRRTMRTRQFDLTMHMMQMGINGRSFDPRRIDFKTEYGQREIWTVRAHMTSHPFHVHGVQFQVLSEGGRSPRPENSGWKDTVLVEDWVNLMVEFSHRADSKHPFMFHCHILEHEDAGMMGQFTVEG